MDPFFGHAPPQWKPNWTTGFADIVLPPSQCFYHDVDPSELPQLIQDLAPQSLKTMYEGGEHAYSGWRDVPTWYLGTTEDMGLPIFAQRMQVGMVRGMDGDVVHREVRSSHSPFLSMKRETSRVVGDAVGAFMGRRVGGEEDREIINRIVVPEVSLWRLPSWWWYGVPYGMGWGIGKVVLVVQWVTGWGR